MAAHAILAALFQRERTGEGQRIEVPMFESVTSFVLTEHHRGRHLVDVPDAAAGYARVLAPWRRPYPTRDGHICLMPYTDDHWRRFFARTDCPELADDPRFASLTERTRHIDELYAALAEIVAGRSTTDWLALCDELDIPAAPVNRLDDLEHDPHLKETGFFQDLTYGERRYRFPTNPVRMERSQVDIAMPPGFGAHTVEVLRSAGVASDEVDRLVASGAAVDGRAG